MTADSPISQAAGLTITEAAATLGCSVDTIRRRIRRGELAARKDVQGRYRVVLSPTGEGATSADGRVLEPARSGPRSHLEILERERATLADELAAWRRQAERAATAEAELRRLLAQAQSLIPRLEADSRRPVGTPGRRWWHRRRGSPAE